MLVCMCVYCLGWQSDGFGALGSIGVVCVCVCACVCVNWVGYAGAEMVEKIIFTPTHHFQPLSPPCNYMRLTWGCRRRNTNILSSVSLFPSLSIRRFFCSLFSRLLYFREKKSLLASNETFYVHIIYMALVELLMSAANLHTFHFSFIFSSL